jgi:hypothetical protein
LASELRQNLSRYLVQVKAGESFAVTERGATMPRGYLLSRARSSSLLPAVGPPSLEVLDEMREERL